MCGITGYVGDRDALPIVSSTLSNLEYRGYDSAGVALGNSALDIYKAEGKIGGLTLPDESSANTGIGHTRWSTHGKPTDANAHPHTDCTGEIAVVHNGIIENYAELKRELEADHTFTSETDTEVVPHLIEDELAAKTLFEAINAVVERLAGSYAIAVMVKDRDEIIAARQDSPLVVGHGDGERFVASDVPAFVEHSRDVTFLEDGDIARITADSVEIYNGGERIDRAQTRVEWEAEAAEKGGYDHFMLKEIHEQPRALRQALTGRVDALSGDVDLDVEMPREYLESLDEIQIVAAGTSYHAGMYAERLVEQLADVRVTTHVASEYDVGGGRDPWQTLVVAITQSGETADTLEALRAAKATGARTMAVTNTVGSTVTREADETVYIHAGPEIGVAATKTFVSQVATVTMLAVALGRTRGALSRDEASAVLDSLRSLPGAIQQVLDRESEIMEIAEEYADKDSFFFLGRQLGYPVALEGALKLKEISYDHAEGFAAGELKHGPLALVTEDALVLSVLTDGSRPEATLHNVAEVDTRGAATVGFGGENDDHAVLDHLFPVPEAGILEPVVANVYMQLFAYHVARLKGRAIDKPRNLAKSVTVQ
ncbi:glutamine--fructose-6-phosphate transaminase (isomerizing), partial [Halodesulfurarchaeum sp.]|uniref:glutamine--fructose-6-phosphate transaminase (isomerizing) n=1 Tax=Halodesulfurarchaeum sp. TaxID=1980530 RepID=UPI002FC2D7CC